MMLPVSFPNMWGLEHLASCMVVTLLNQRRGVAGLLVCSSLAQFGCVAKLPFGLEAIEK